MADGTPVLIAEVLRRVADEIETVIPADLEVAGLYRQGWDDSRRDVQALLRLEADKYEKGAES